MSSVSTAEINQKKESKQEKQTLQSPGSRTHAFSQELDEHSPTCSTARRLKDSPRDQSWQQNKNSSVSARKRKHLNSFQSPASLQGENDNSVQKRSTLFPESPWSRTTESSSPSRQQSSRNNIQGERQRSTGQQSGRPKVSKLTLSQTSSRHLRVQRSTFVQRYLRSQSQGRAHLSQLRLRKSYTSSLK